MERSGPWIVDVEERTLTWSGGTVELTARELALVEYFQARPDVLVTRRELETEIWGFARGVRSEVVPVTVRRLRRKLGGTGLQTVRGRGWRLVHETKALDVDFFGRDEDLTRVRDLLDGSQGLISIVGPGGVGKTRLTRELCSEANDRHFVDLSATSDATVMATAMASALCAPVGEGDAVDAVSNALRMLESSVVVVDNVEQLPVEALHLLSVWQEAAPQIRFVATSRQRLGLPGEQIVRLEPLSESAAIAMFVARARTLGVDVDPGCPDLKQLVDHLDRLPLALELAASRTAVLDVAGLLAQIDRRFRLLANAETGPDRHRTLHGCVAWSWDALTAEESGALEQLSVFAGAFTLADAEAVVELDSEEWVLDVMQRLVDRSLLQRRSQGRFGLLETMKAFGRARLRARDAFDSAIRRHAVWFARLGSWEVFEDTLKVGRASGSNAQRLARAEIGTALQRQAVSPDAEIYAGLVVAAWAIVRWVGPLGSIRSHFEAVLRLELPIESAARVSLCAHEEALLSWRSGHASPFDAGWSELSPSLYGRLLDIWGRMELRMGRRASGWDHLQRAAEVLERAGDELPEISARVILAASRFQHTHDAEEAARLHACEGRLRALDHPRLQVECALYLASIDRSEDSIGILEGALKIAQDAGDMVSASRCTWAIGTHGVRLHREQLTRGMALFRELSAGQYPSSPRWLALAGDVAFIDGDPDAAERFYLRGLAMAESERPEGSEQSGAHGLRALFERRLARVRQGSETP